jgi:hypothetical protein
MSKTFYRAAGGLLLLLGALMGWLGLVGSLPNARSAVYLAAGFGGVGFVLLALGLRSPFPASHRRLVTRKFTPWNIVIGAAMIAGGVGILHLYYNVIHVMPRIVLIGAMLAIPFGVFVAASIFGDACARCDQLLESKTLQFASVPDGALARLRAGDAEGALGLLGEPAADGPGRLRVGYCPTCKAVAVCRAGAEVLVLRDFHARLLADRARRA